MWLARMNRISASGPPWSGAGARRRASPTPAAGVIAAGSASSGSIDRIVLPGGRPAMIAPAMS